MITRHLEAILSPLFEDLDNNIAFRWTSVSDDESQASIRPDASINIINGAMLSDRIGCGKVKAQYQAPNHRLVGIDLMRVATLAKNASDKHKLKCIFAFLVVGKNATFYILDRTKSDLYIMCEIAHIQLPFSLDQIPLFIPQLNKVIKVISCFQSAVNGDKHNYAQNPITLTENTMHQIIDTKVFKKRKATFSHYSY
ncbi:hypothetical protein CLU79DRAFT_363397 [Phycomyces nitens]|nr:hypothetical protein CLU79DRAFT_363397 [Phycomyces nitens]